MEQPGFDPGDFYEFDLARGAVRTRGGARVLVLSDGVVRQLVSAALQKGDLTALRSLGEELGAQARASLGAGIADLAPEVVLGHASGHFALFGFGRIRLDTWGDSLVVSVDGAPQLDRDGNALGALLGGMFSALSGQELVCVPIGPDAQFMMVAPGVAPDVHAWAKQGADVATVAARLVPEAT